MPDTLPIGSILGISTSLFWTLAPFLFASAVRRLGAYNSNAWRLGMASAVLWILCGAYCLVLNPHAVASVNAPALAWLVTSGVVGLVIGDALYFVSLGMLGPRRTLQILVLAPVFATAIAWVAFDERISAVGLAGILVTMSALFAATYREREGKPGAEPGVFSLKGASVALGATVLHAAATVLVRKAYLVNPGMDTIAATAIRVSSSAAAIWLVVLARGHAPAVLGSVRGKAHALGRLAGGVALGPVLGMICYVSALKFAPSGIVSVLTSLSPILIIPITAWRYKTALNIHALICMVLAVAGVTMVILR